MADERALTTHEVRTSYARRFPDADWAERAARFDGWLAAHDREVVEAVVVRIAESVQNHWRNP